MLASKAIRLKRRTGLSEVISYVILSLWALTTIYPFVWVTLNSFKDRRHIRTDAFSLPFGDLFTLNNYTETFDKFNIWSAYRNSLVISGTVTVVVVLLAGMCAYGMTRYVFRGRRVLNSVMVAAMMFPVFATIIPVFTMENSWGIVNTAVPLSWLSVALPQIAGNMSFSTLVLMGYIRSLPIDLEEAAYLEGYSVIRIFFRIIMPLARPSFATIAIFTLLWSLVRS